MSEEAKKFYRSRSERIIFGVCGGLANYFKVDVTLIRVLFIVLALLGSFGIVLYLLLAVITPLEAGQEINNSQAKEMIRDFKAGAEQIASEFKDADLKSTKNLAGLIILIMGVVLLLQQTFHFRFNWHILIPFIIIFFGLYLVIKHNKK